MHQLDQHIIDKIVRDVASLQSVPDEDFFLGIQRLMEWFTGNPNLQGIIRKLIEERERDSREYQNSKNDLREHLLSTLKYYRRLRRDNEEIQSNDEIYEKLKKAKQYLIAENLHNVSYEEGLHRTIFQALDRIASLEIPIDETISKAFHEEWETNIKNWDRDEQSLECFDRYISPIIKFIKESIENGGILTKEDLLNDLCEDLDAYYPKNLISDNDFRLTLNSLKRIGELLRNMQIKVNTRIMDNLDQKYSEFIQQRRILEERERVSPYTAFFILRLTLNLHSDWSKADHMTTHAVMHLVGIMQLIISRSASLSPSIRQEYLKYLDTLIRFVKDNLETRNAISDILQAFKRRCEWYSYRELQGLCQKSQRETAITIKTLEYLYDKGLLPLYKPMMGNKQPDVVELENALVLEIKVTEGKKAEIVKGFKQAFDYASSYTVSTGYYLIFNYGESSLDIPPVIPSQDKEIHIITINLHENPPSTERKLNVIRITRDDLLSSED